MSVDMNEPSMIAVSEILDSFDEDEISSIIDEQLGTNESIASHDYLATPKDFFQPLFYNYTKLHDTEGLPEEIMEDAEKKFYKVCNIIIDRVLTAYHMSINKDYVTDNYANTPALALGFYNFFIINLKSTLEEFFENYIVKNSTNLARTFEGMKTKKDVSTLSNKKILSNEMALIASNIYDIIVWIIDNVNSSDTFFEYISKEYLPGALVRTLINEGNLGGDFISILREIISTNNPLKSEIGFNIIVKIKNGEIKDIFAELNKE